PSSGASGDMIMACLLDLGADPNAVRAAVESVGCGLEISRDEKHHIGAARVRVLAGGKRYKTLAEARSILAGSSLPPSALDRAQRIMEILAAAEGRVHGVAREEARFHEIGVLDALADIVGSCAGLESLGVEKVLVLPISVGSGTVIAAHGRLPVPAPATLEVLKESGLLWRGGPVEGELLTPTGAAILAGFADKAAREYPLLRADAAGYGSGTRDLEVPNLLRGVVGELLERPGHPADHHHHDRVVQLETNVDDVTGEVLGNLLDLLMEEGALDVSIVPALMKKGRPANVVKVIARKEEMDRLARIVMRETGSLGIRIFPSLHRYVAKREERTIGFEIDGRTFSVRAKLSYLGDEILQIKAEHDDCRRIATEVGLPLREVSRRAEERAWREISRPLSRR
ncbi:nickel pincer cofactor biosynthesis protein LarC, partial [Methanocrinis sp.]|uniref:nickel pincer cofactor biosynthesis protein LarC n=1 Tax=Methanocrinis sp. TaxID=3101522 RepID=UPI003D0AB24F